MDNSNSVDSKFLSATLDGSIESCIPNGCLAVNKAVELTDEGDEAERVGVLDYMPSYKHRPSDIKYTDVSSRIDLPLLRAQNSGSCDKESFIKAAEATPGGRDIELKTFSITESSGNLIGRPCASLRAARRLAPLSCLSDDDELLVPPEGADAEDGLLQEVVVQSEQAACTRAPLSHGATVVSFDSQGTQRAGRPLAAAGQATSFRCIPKQFSIVRDAVWSNPDTARTSPINSPEPTGTAPVASKNNASASSHSGGCESVVGQRFVQQGQSSSRDQSPVDELNKDSEVHLAGDNSQPAEMLSVDRSQVDPSSLSRQNVVFLNDYFWPPTRALYRDDSGAVEERTEVVKRQERRDKRKKIHSLPVALAEDVAGYVGEGKSIEELIDYITMADSKDGALKRKTSQDGHPSQDDAKKPYGPTKSSKQVQIPKAKSESNKANEMAKFCDGTSSVDGLDSSDSVDGTKMTLPGDCSSRILVHSGSDSLMKNSVSQDVGGITNISEDAKRKRKRKSHKAFQRGGEDSKTGEDSSGKLAAGFAKISLGTPVEFGANFCTAAEVKEAQMETVSSSLLNDLEDGTPARTEVNVERVTVHDRSSKHAKKSTEVKEDIVEVQSSVDMTRPGEGAISSVLRESSLPLDSEASTVVLSPTNDQPSRPTVASIPSTGAASNPEPDDGVSLLEESGQWQEFQSKKKRMRNAAPQSVGKNPSMTAQKSATSACAVPVAPPKKTAPEAVSVATVHASAAVRGTVDTGNGHKFPIAAGYFPKVVRQGRYHGNIQSANDVSNSSDKLFHYIDFAAGNTIESSNRLQLGDDFQVSNRQNEADFDVGRLEGASYARMAAKDSNGLSCGPQTSPSTGILSSFGPQSEAASDKATTVAEASDDKVTYCKEKAKTKKSSNTDRSTEPLWDRHKVSTAEKSQLDKMRDDIVAKSKKAEATIEKPGSKPSANLSKGSRVSDATARPAVVFCGKVDSQSSEQYSFEYSDDLVGGHPSGDVATRSVADAHIASGRFQSCESASSTSGGINCGRPIAPLTGTGHASLARAPILVVTPLQKVLHEEVSVSRIIDADPETLKEATIVAPSACRSAPAEAKEPASRMSVVSLLAGPSLAQNLSDRGEPGLADDGLVSAASHSLQTEIGEHEPVQNWNTPSSTQLKAVPEKKMPRERNSSRHTTALHSSKKTFVFNVLEAAQYLTVDWEGLLIDDFAVYYSPDEQ